MAAIADTPTISASSSSAAATAVTANGSAVGGMGTAMHDEFKREPHEDMGMGNGMFPVDLLASPKIRLTPTIKLMPSPNATDPKRKFICPYEHCTKSYGKSSHLRSHLTWHTGVKPFVCHEAGCGKGFTRSDELNRHVRTHTGEKPFECLQCGKKFSRSDHLTKHLATHAKQMQNPGKKTRFTQPQVATNGAASRWAEELVERKPQITPQQALFNAGCHTPDGIDFNDGMHFMAALMSSAKAHPVARDAYVEPENLAYNGHALDHAPIKIKLERPERGSDYHVVHDSVAAAAEETEDDEDDDQGPMIKVVSTMVCPSSPPERKFGSASAAAEAAHNSDDDYDDPDDDAIMPEANVVLAPPLPVVSVPSKPPQPVLTGDPERPYGCNQCEKSFKRQDDLSRHMRTHSGEKPYECGECHKRFMRSDHLKKHQKTHNKAR